MQNEYKINEFKKMDSTVYKFQSKQYAKIQNNTGTMENANFGSTTNKSVEISHVSNFFNFKLMRPPYNLFGTFVFNGLKIPLPVSSTFRSTFTRFTFRAGEETSGAVYI